MKHTKTATIAAALAVLLTFAGCAMPPEPDRTVVKEPDKTIVVLENENTGEEADLPQITIEKIDNYPGMEMTDWLDEQTVVLAKENQELGKMSLAENAEFYPRSLYLYNLDTKEYKTVQARKNMFLGGAVLSPDKKHLLYYEYSIGDTAYYLMRMDAQEQSPVAEEALGIAYTAEWADAQTVIGVSYAGGAYMADTNRNITPIAELQEEQLYTVQKMQDKIYYITTESPSMELYLLDLKTGEKKKLDVENAEKIIPSPDGNQLLISQAMGSTRRLLLTDTEGSIKKIIAEGTEVTGVSWSLDQRMIAYRLASVSNGTTASGLYLYDVLTGKSIQLVVDIGDARTSWSPSGKKIAVAESDGRSHNSSIIYLK